MARHTPPRPVAVEEFFPELVPFRREALRLHPRAGAPSCRESSVGGPLLWPADEPWPTCDVADGAHEGTVAMVPVVQLYLADARGVPYPEGSDLLQVLWCPFEHGEFCCPLPVVRWRDAGAVGEVRSTPPAPAEAEEEQVPSPCVVHPEWVTEYPSWDLPDELREALGDRFERLRKDTGWRYWYHLADAPGIKVGGYPGWTQEPYWPECASCGGRMEHLLTVASWEYDGESRRTWVPVEDRIDGEPDRAALDAAGLMLGDVGGVYIFECRACPDRPVGHWFDCS